MPSVNFSECGISGAQNCHHVCCVFLTQYFFKINCKMDTDRNLSTMCCLNKL